MAGLAAILPANTSEAVSLARDEVGKKVRDRPNTGELAEVGMDDEPVTADRFDFILKDAHEPGIITNRDVVKHGKARSGRRREW